MTIPRTHSATWGLLALVVACSGHYQVGEGTGGGANPDASAGRNPGAGGRDSGEQPAFGGGPPRPRPPMGAGGAVSFGGGANNPDGSPGGPGGPTPSACEAAAAPSSPAEVRASSEVLWARLTAFLLGTEIAPLEPLPASPSPLWVRRTAQRLLVGDFPEEEPASAFARVLSRWPVEDAVAERYGEKLNAEDATLARLFTPTEPELSEAGILTEKSLLTQAPAVGSRGAFILKNLLCQLVPPPPADIDMSLPPFEGGSIREFRERILPQPACRACHSLMDPPGYSLEHYDSSGDYREAINGNPIDASGQFTAPGGTTTFEFSSVVDLAPQLAEACEVARCVAQQTLALALESGLGWSSEDALSAASDEQLLGPVVREFRASEQSTHALVEAIVTSPPFVH